jgi:hypothetical protein
VGEFEKWYGVLTTGRLGLGVKKKFACPEWRRKSDFKFIKEEEIDNKDRVRN